MTETAQKATPQPTTDTFDNRKVVLTASPLSHFRHEHCNTCPYFHQCAKNDNLELRCILSRIALDLHTITRNNTVRGKHPDR